MAAGRRMPFEQSRQTSGFSGLFQRFSPRTRIQLHASGIHYPTPFRPRPPLPVISVIISNFNGCRFLPRLLESLRNQRGVAVELIVVDRQSRDGSLEYLAAQTDVLVLSEPPESGLVSGYSVGAAAATGELLFFCNEDMWFDPDCLQQLEAGIDLSARICSTDGWHRTYDGAAWLHRGVRFESYSWAINSPHPRVQTNFENELPAGTRVPYACAGAFMIHRDVFRELGGWDRSFFLDHEDTDLFLRAWQRGWHCVSIPGARIYHAVNASNEKIIPNLGTKVAFKRYVAQRANLMVIALKYFSWSAVAMAAAQWPVVLVNNLLHARWRNVQGDLCWIKEMIRRWPAAQAFRRANQSWNCRFPGERFFFDRTFRD